MFLTLKILTTWEHYGSVIVSHALQNCCINAPIILFTLFQIIGQFSFFLSQTFLILTKF
jgi:hypothetical protein